MKLDPTGISTSIEAVSSLAETIARRILPEKASETEKAEAAAIIQAAINEQQKLNNEAERDRLADVSNARGREVEITKSTGKRDLNLYVLAWLVVAGFFILMGLMIFVTMPADNIGPVNQLFGALSTGFGMVLQYFFGSSRGSARKTELMSAVSGGKK